ncbi:MAG TPA: hypothetical protein VET89_02660 [Stellaceae bacterium]|nr:hypothetical protein [Stellaceae bacterium]
MPSACLSARTVPAALFGAALAIAAATGTASAQIGPQANALLDRLCSQTLRTNEEDRLYGMISAAVRSTIRYHGGAFVPDIVDDAVQDSLDAMIEACPQIATIPESQRLAMAIDTISTATTKALEDDRNVQNAGNAPLGIRRQPEKLTAADLSEELSSQEIDQWLDAMPPRQRATALFLYASDVTPGDVAAALGVPPAALSRQASTAKTDLLRLFREDWEEPPATPRGGPAIQYRESGAGFAGFMKGSSAPEPASAPASEPASGVDARPDDGAVPEAIPVSAAAAGPLPAIDGVPPAGLRVTGISSDLYAGWSLLATARGLPRGQRLDITEPFLLEPNAKGIKRMLVVGLVEIGDPDAETRRFLLKAYAIDGEGEAAGLRDSFHLGATAVDNEEAKKTLANPNLSSIEIARCLWHDFGTAEDPGLCR